MVVGCGKKKGHSVGMTVGVPMPDSHESVTGIVVLDVGPSQAVGAQLCRVVPHISSGRPEAVPMRGGELLPLLWPFWLRRVAPCGVVVNRPLSRPPGSHGRGAEANVGSTLPAPMPLLTLGRSRNRTTRRPGNRRRVSDASQGSHRASARWVSSRCSSNRLRSSEDPRPGVEHEA
jgi:hypothetical protein